MEFLNTDKIWNRAVLHNGGEAPANGDYALAALLRMHGLIMNGGVFHAVEVLREREFHDAIAGYAFFGLRGIKELLARAVELFDSGVDLDSYEALFDLEYAKLIPDDSFLVRAFEHHHAANPNDFAPI